MPWKECSVMSERIKFIARLLDGEKMTDLCKDFHISRKTGYKILNRYKNEGLNGLQNKSSRPYNSPRKTHPLIEKKIIETKEIHKTWGALKIREYLNRKHPQLKTPSVSTVHSILEKHHLTKKRKRFKNNHKAKGTNLITPSKPNQLWCADFKGQLKMKNSVYCYPLTITDQYSRYLISCEGLGSVKQNASKVVFERAFKEFGVSLKP